MRHDFCTPFLHGVVHCVRTPAHQFLHAAFARCSTLCVHPYVTLFARSLWQLRAGRARTVGDSNTEPVCMHCACMAYGTPSTVSNRFFFRPPGTDFPRCRGYHCTHTVLLLYTHKGKQRMYALRMHVVHACCAARATTNQVHSSALAQ